jgi:hypothetical protein
LSRFDLSLAPNKSGQFLNVEPFLLFLENPEFVADEIPEESGGGAADGSQISPQFSGKGDESDAWSDAVHENARGCHVDRHPDDAHKEKLGKLLGLLGFLFVLECPIFVEEVAENHGAEKRESLKSGIIYSFAFSAQEHFEVQDGDVDEKVHKADQDEFRELGNDGIFFCQVRNEFGAHSFLF